MGVVREQGVMADRPVGDLAPEARVELGVEFLATIEAGTLSLAEAITRLEAITGDPSLQRQILDAAEQRGVIVREDGVLDVRSSQYVSYQTQVVAREGSYECRRCGASLSTGYFIEYDAGAFGPFGSSCVRKVTGRDD